MLALINSFYKIATVDKANSSQRNKSKELKIMEQITQTAANASEAAKFNLTISAVAGSDGAKESATLWIGRQIGKAPRKDLQLSQAIPQIGASLIAQLDAERIATIINDEFLAYVRRVKCQRLDLAGNSSITLPLPVDSLAYANLVVNMLSAPATRAKRLVSTSSLRALVLCSEYKDAAKHVLGIKLDAWQRVGEREMLPLAVAQDARVATARASVRDAVVIRCMEIAALMPEGEQRLVLEAAAEMLADVEIADMDDSI